MFLLFGSVSFCSIIF
ncbi:hypothetical protein CFP56_034544 [Quercus suber]|uniref:Uncharacterized protein n=1 Tax=Quercus suber TaxID=58331 RepID=A0AAW0JCR3_QUESU